VGVISIDSPPDTVYADSAVAVAATVVNFGDSTEASFFVSATIDGYSDATMVASIAPGETLQVTFDPWMVPSPCDTTYTATIITLLGVDQNPANDTLTTETYARCPEGISQEPMSSIPRSLALLHSRPNPFSTSTEIRYQLPVETHVTINVYDPCGRLVRNLLDKVEAPGFKQVVWNGQADDGKALNSGIYFCKLHVRKASTIGQFTQTRKLILLR